MLHPQYVHGFVCPHIKIESLFLLLPNDHRIRRRLSWLDTMRYYTAIRYMTVIVHYTLFRSSEEASPVLEVIEESIWELNLEELHERIDVFASVCCILKWYSGMRVFAVDTIENTNLQLSSLSCDGFLRLRDRSFPRSATYRGHFLDCTDQHDVATSGIA